MADERVRLELQDRPAVGSAASRRLRKQGLVPGVLYGGGKNAQPICVPERELRRVLTGEHGLHAILDVVLNGQRPRPSILKAYERDPVHGRVKHVDLQEVRLDRPIQAQVTVELVGEPAGVKEGGVLTQVVREVNVQALPMEIPDRIELDVTAMGMNDTLRLADVPPREGVEYLDDPEQTVLATVIAPTPVIEEVVEEPEQAPEGAAEAPADAGGDAAGAPDTVAG